VQARALLIRGAALALSDLDETSERAKDLCRQLSALGSRYVFLSADVSNPDQTDRMIRDAAGAFGRLDMAFNNAGINGRTESPLLDRFPFETWEKVIGVNLTGVFNCLKTELQIMEPTGGGAIVNTASIASYVDCLANSAYTASKHGVAGLTKHVASNYGTRGFRCNAVAPGIIDTPMSSLTRGNSEIAQQQLAANPQGKFGTPEEVAGAVVWLCSSEASFVNGHLLTIDGGYTIR